MVDDASDHLRQRARPVLRAALIWACGGALLALIGAIVHDPTMIYPALSLLIAVGILLVIVAAGFRLAGNRDHNGIPMKNLIYTGAITAIAAAAVLVLLSLIFTSPAASSAPAAIAAASLGVAS
ncbi:hypothetical protein ACIPY5_19855 [Microbacterium sp. NPDC089698]|uniref:hypothetical protein n=1 Tax=Microbacterium sp. NPDC089698 TaxID=3364200 RepID=UPI003805F78C